MPEIQYPTNPNSDTAFVVQEDGTKNRALMTAPQDTSTLELPSNSNSTKGYVTVDGKKQRVILTADIGGGGGSVDYAKTVQRAETMPTADSSNTGQQFLYSGESDATYTHGYIYENVATTVAGSATASQTTGSSLSDIAVDVETFEEELDEYDIPKETGNYVFTYDGADWYLNGTVYDPADFGVTFTGTPVADDVITVAYTAATTTYAWTQIDVQPAPSGLPDQTGQSGKFLTTDGTDASWSDKPPLVNNATGGYNRLAVGGGASVTADYGTAFGALSSVNSSRGIAIGNSASAHGTRSIAIGGKTNANNAIQLGATSSTTSNSDANTFKVANANGNYEIMSADGTVPTARLTKVNTTATLAVADWSSSTQTVTVSGVKADSVVFVSPDPTSASDYASAGILCTSQSADSLTFTATTTPSNAITVNVVCL